MHKYKLEFRQTGFALLSQDCTLMVLLWRFMLRCFDSNAHVVVYLFENKIRGMMKNEIRPLVKVILIRLCTSVRNK